MAVAYKVTALDSESNGPSSSLDLAPCVLSLDKTFFSNSAFLHPGVYMGTGGLLGEPDRMLGSNIQRTGIPSRGGLSILLVSLCYGNPSYALVIVDH